VKISTISDLHLEFCEFAGDLPGGDILLLAGDIFSAAPFLPKKTDAKSRGARRRAIKFCRQQLSKYSRVFYTLGNHEHYFGTFEETANVLRAFLRTHAPNVTLLDDQVAEIEGITVIGTTLWARCGVGQSSYTEWRIGKEMRDFTAIRTTRLPLPQQMKFWQGSRAFRPFDANDEHQKALAFLRDAAKTDRPVILLSHHAPSLLSAHGVDYGTDYLDDAYCTNLFDIFEQHPNIKLAVHGHTHHHEHYRLAETLVIANPRGYFPYESRSRFFDPAAEDIQLADLFKERLP